MEENKLSETDIEVAAILYATKNEIIANLITSGQPLHAVRNAYKDGAEWEQNRSRPYIEIAIAAMDKALKEIVSLRNEIMLLKKDTQ